MGFLIPGLPIRMDVFDGRDELQKDRPQLLFRRRFGCLRKVSLEESLRLRVIIVRKDEC